MTWISTRVSTRTAAIALALAIGGCATPLVAEDPAAERPRGSMPELGSPEDDPPLETAEQGLDDFDIVTDPGGEVMLDVADMVVAVGQEILVTFTTRVHHIDPTETYLAVVNAPETAEIDLVAGTFTWIPEEEDVGIHVISFDLWYETEDELLDAQRLVIEVVPADSLIEVGI